MLCNICQEEFQIRPVFDHETLQSKFGGITGFRAILKFNQKVICHSQGQNKKDAKFACAKLAIQLVAPNVFKQRYPNEKFQEVEEHDLQNIVPADKDENEILTPEDQLNLENEITLSDPRLQTMTHLFKP